MFGRLSGISLRGMSNQVFSTISRIIEPAVTYISGPGTLGKANIDLFELLPIAPLGLALMHEIGKDRAHGDTFGTASLSKAGLGIAEGAITHGLAQTTENAIPLLALGWGAYRIGMEESPIEKAKAAIKAAVLFPLGLLGIYGGQWVSDKFAHRDATGLTRHLTSPEMTRFINGTYAAGSAEAGLQTALRNLSATTTPHAGHLEHLIMGRPGFDKNAARLAAETFETSAKAAMTHLHELGPERFVRTIADQAIAHGMPAVRSTEQAAHLLANTLSRSQSGLVRILRMLNPSVGYMLLTTAIGLPIVTAIANGMGLKHNTTRQSVRKDMVPLWLDDGLAYFGLIQDKRAPGASNGHGGGGSMARHTGVDNDSYLMADGPGVTGMGSHMPTDYDRH